MDGCMEHDLKHELREIRRELRQILGILKPHPTSITFQEITMNPTQGGYTLVFTGTLAPAGAVYPADTTFTVTSNDPAVSPTVDTTGLVVTVPLPTGWVESTSVALAIQYAASSSEGSLSAVITPSAPPASFPTGITFAQTS